MADKRQLLLNKLSFSLLIFYGTTKTGWQVVSNITMVAILLEFSTPNYYMWSALK